ncbi:hypothetical protein [Candidatus Uabimicrobium amorphum]|uniref:Uncharacterized protein n=1 Tax=Uabimicrobium amorphum TaxID=2596890 RepID=A0A5S9IM75_UABAM|nr:hypothetical protein [Candidatus Uabimicrobium amorphum]BBM84016.1 hypothetical protein UABAM_02371 [Candidatus Uabimicrobium amorphum]
MQELEVFLNEQVIIDTKSSYLFIGNLQKIGDFFLTMTDVDVHDQNDFSKTKEIYVMEAAKYGIKINRKSVNIVKAEMISISLLSDIVKY